MMAAKGFAFIDYLSVPKGDVYAEILEAIVNSPLSWEAFGKPQQNSLLQSLDWLRVRSETC